MVELSAIEATPNKYSNSNTDENDKSSINNKTIKTI